MVPIGDFEPYQVTPGYAPLDPMSLRRAERPPVPRQGGITRGSGQLETGRGEGDKLTPANLALFRTQQERRERPMTDEDKRRFRQEERERLSK